MQQGVTINTLRLVIVAMTIGMAAFGAVAIVLGMRADPAPDLQRMLLAALAVFGVGEFLGYLALRGTIITMNRRRYRHDLAPADATRLYTPVILTTWLIGCAMAEGFGLFGLLIFLLSGAWPAVLAPVIGLVILVVMFPNGTNVPRAVEKITGQRQQ